MLCIFIFEKQTINKKFYCIAYPCTYIIYGDSGAVSWMTVYPYSLPLYTYTLAVPAAWYNYIDVAPCCMRSSIYIAMFLLSILLSSS